MEGRVVQFGVAAKSKGRGKDRCAFLIFFGMGRYIGTWMEGV